MAGQGQIGVAELAAGGFQAAGGGAGASSSSSTPGGDGGGEGMMGVCVAPFATAFGALPLVPFFLPPVTCFRFALNAAFVFASLVRRLTISFF